MDFSKFKKVKISDSAKKAKLGALGGLQDEMHKLMADDLRGAKKVTVASPDKEGLKEGLDKAKDMLGDGESEESQEEEAAESPEEEASETPEMEASEPEHKELDAEEHAIMEHLESPEEIDELIKMLEAKKAHLSRE